MKSYSYSQARQQLARLLDVARREGSVEIRRQDGSVFVVTPVDAEGSPLDVPGVRTRLRKAELTRLLREERGASGERLMSRLADKRSAQTNAPDLPRRRRAKKR